MKPAGCTEVASVTDTQIEEPPIQGAMKSCRFGSPDLETAVAKVYAAFKSYALRSPDLVVCNCPSCMTPADERKLVATPLEEIPAKLLAQYTQSAVYWNERASREMRYFLPRYCDLIAHDQPPSPSGELDYCLSRLGHNADWRETWPNNEVAALENFFIALLLDRLLRIETIADNWGGVGLQERIEKVLALAITAGATLSPLLAAWEAAPEPGATLHMAAVRFEIRHYDNGQPPRLPFAYLDRHRAESEAIARFVLREAVASRIENAFFETEDKAHQSILSAAVGPLWRQPAIDQ